METLAECLGCRRDKSHKCTRCRGTGNEPKTIVAELWCCPACGSYYGGSASGDLDEKVNFEINSSVPKSTRDRCPYCGETRIKCAVVVHVPIRGDYEGEFK